MDKKETTVTPPPSTPLPNMYFGKPKHQIFNSRTLRVVAVHVYTLRNIEIFTSEITKCPNALCLIR